MLKKLEAEKDVLVFQQNKNEPLVMLTGKGNIMYAFRKCIIKLIMRDF